MRRIIIDYYNGKYHLQFWLNGTLILTKDSALLDEGMLQDFLHDRILPDLE